MAFTSNECITSSFLFIITQNLCSRRAFLQPFFFFPDGRPHTSEGNNNKLLGIFLFSASHMPQTEAFPPPCGTIDDQHAGVDETAAISDNRKLLKPLPQGMEKQPGQHLGDMGMDDVINSEDTYCEAVPRPEGCWYHRVKGAAHRVMPPGGILASSFNLASGSIGAGILGLPGATDSAGLIMAVIYLILITFFSVFSMHTLAIVAERTNNKSFEGVARTLFPKWRHAFSYWVAFVRWFYSFGACVGYVISVGDCFHPIFAEAHRRSPDNAALRFFDTTVGNKLMSGLMWLCVMLPLVLPKHIDSLRYASTVAVSFMIYFVIIVVIHSCLNGFSEHARHVVAVGDHGDPPQDVVYLFRTGNKAMDALGVFLFAYVCQINAYEVLWDMPRERRSVKNFTLASLIGMLICGILYLMVCIFAYFDFGSAKLQGNSILLMYNPLAEPAVMLAYVGVLVKLCVAYALLGMAARNSIYYLINWQQRYHTAKENPVVASTGKSGAMEAVTSTRSPPTNSTVRQICPDRDDSSDFDNSGTYVDNIPMTYHLITVITLSGVILLCGLFIPNIQIVFGFAGSISGGFLAFIFPALYYMYVGQFSIAKAGAFRYFTTYALLLCGVVGVVFGTGATIYSTFGGK